MIPSRTAAAIPGSVRRPSCTPSEGARSRSLFTLSILLRIQYRSWNLNTSGQLPGERIEQFQASHHGSDCDTCVHRLAFCVLVAVAVAVNGVDERVGVLEIAVALESKSVRQPVRSCSRRTCLYRSPGTRQSFRYIMSEWSILVPRV